MIYSLSTILRSCANDTPISCNHGSEYGFWLNFDTWKERAVEPNFGTPLCGSLPSNIGSTCAILNNSVVSVGGFDCSSAQRLQVSSRVRRHLFMHYLGLVFA